MTNSNYSKGGRGKKAPYETTHYRVPEPCKDSVELLAKTWKHLLLTDEGESQRTRNLLIDIENICTMHYTQEFDKPVNGYIYKPVTEFKGIDLLGNKIKQILEEALTYKSNAGGKIKDKIREVLKLIDD